MLVVTIVHSRRQITSCKDPLCTQEAEYAQNQRWRNKRSQRTTSSKYPAGVNLVRPHKVWFCRDWKVQHRFSHASVDGSSERTPHTPLHRVPVPSHPRLLCKPRHETRRADTKAYKQQTEPGTACWDACSALLRNTLCVPLFLAGVFDSEELHLLHRGHRNGLSSCMLGCRLGCHLGSRDTVMRDHSARALICDGPVVNTAL